MNQDRYQCRKAQGLCVGTYAGCLQTPAPGHVFCAACRAKIDAWTLARLSPAEQAWRLRFRARRATRAVRRTETHPWYPLDAELPQGSWVAHCDGWSPVQSLPVVCGRCGVAIMEDR